jgi:hypothetical protein
MSAEDRGWLDEYFADELVQLRKQTAGLRRPTWLAPEAALAPSM